MSEVIIREATSKEADALYFLEITCMPNPWEQEALDNLISDENKTALIAIDSNIPAGYIGLSWVLDEAEVGNICVREDYRRRHIAENLMNKAFEYLKAKGVNILFLEVESDNEPAKKLYDKLGFEVYNCRRDYYGSGRDALLMRKNID